MDEKVPFITMAPIRVYKEMGYKMEINKKKQYLGKYMEIKRQVKIKQEQISEYRAEIMSIKIGQNEGMPSAHKMTDLSDYMARLDNMISELIRIKNQQLIYCISIQNSIERLESDKEKEVLTLKYLKGTGWIYIAEQMNYSVRTVQRIHGNALVHIEIPDF